MSVLDAPGGQQPRQFRQETDEQLLIRYAEGSLEAREEIARRYMPMARRLAARHSRSSEAQDDLDQVAYLGLLKTIDRYDPSAGSFVGYAVTTIRGELKRHFRDHGWTVHVARPVQERYLQVSAAADAFAASQGRTPTVGELADRTGLAIEDVAEALDAAQGYSPSSLDAPAGADPDDPSRTLADTIGREEAGYDRVEFGEAIAPGFRRLPERQQRMLHMRFVEDLTQSEIAERCGVSQMHVSRLLRRSLNELLDAIATTDIAGAGYGRNGRFDDDGKGEAVAKDHGSSVKNDKQYEGLRKKGMSKERAAKIANTKGASKKGGKNSGGGSKKS